MVVPAPRKKLTNQAAREVILGWFSGRPDLADACIAIVSRMGEYWWAHALDARVVAGRRFGLGCEDAEEVRVALVAAGWAMLGSFTGSAEEREELAPPEVRVALLRAVATLEAVDTGELPTGA